MLHDITIDGRFLEVTTPPRVIRKQLLDSYGILGDLCTQEFARRWSLEQELGRKADKDCKVTECMARNTDFGWTRWVKMTVEKIHSYSIRLVFNKRVTQAQGFPKLRGRFPHVGPTREEWLDRWFNHRALTWSAALGKAWWLISIKKFARVGTWVVTSCPMPHPSFQHEFLFCFAGFPCWPARMLFKLMWSSMDHAESCGAVQDQEVRAVETISLPDASAHRGHADGPRTSKPKGQQRGGKCEGHNRMQGLKEKKGMTEWPWSRWKCDDTKWI